MCRPSILSLDTCILSYGCHMHPCFHMTPPWPPFGLDRFLSLVQVHLRSNVVQVCSSFWSSVKVNLPSCSHHAIGKEVRPPKNFSSVGIHRSRFEFRAFGLVLIISLSFDLRIVHRFFYGLIILQETFYQNFKIFLNRIDRLASSSTGSSSQLIWSTDFGDFGAQFLHGLGPWTPDQFWAIFWIHFGPYF